MPAFPRIAESQLVPAALDVLDELGLEGLSMRVLADRLGVRAASLYGHLRNKEDLLSRVADAMCLASLTGATDLPWQEELRSIAERLRSQLRSHPGAAAVVATQPVTRQVAERFAPLADRLATEMECSVTDASLAIQSIYLFTAAHALAEHGNPPSGPDRPRSYYDRWFQYALAALIVGFGRVDASSP